MKGTGVKQKRLESKPRRKMYIVYTCRVRGSDDLCEMSPAERKTDGRCSGLARLCLATTKVRLQRKLCSILITFPPVAWRARNSLRVLWGKGFPDVTGTLSSG